MDHEKLEDLFHGTENKSKHELAQELIQTKIQLYAKNIEFGSFKCNIMQIKKSIQENLRSLEYLDPNYYCTPPQSPSYTVNYDSEEEIPEYSKSTNRRRRRRRNYSKFHQPSKKKKAKFLLLPPLIICLLIYLN